jgi:hypothetical protein
MSQADALTQIVAEIRQELATATEALMIASEAGLKDVALLRDGDEAALERIESGFLSVLEACLFEDLIGQRLTQLQSTGAASASLENGPARHGQGLDQAAADDLFGA